MGRLPNTYFTKTSGGLGKSLPSEDPISGLVFYNNTIPAKWSTNSTGDCNWATTTNYVIGDIVYESITKLFYIALTDHTSSTFATDLANGDWEIKKGENIKLIRRILDLEKLGILENSVNHSVEFYQVSEFFRLNTDGYLYLSINPIPVSWNFSEVYDLQNEVEGKIRQIGVFNTIPFATTEITALQLIADQLSVEYMPVQLLYTADFVPVTDITTLTSLRTLQAPKVSIIIGMDGSGDGYSLYQTKGYSICDIGAALGALSLVLVNESIASPELINFASAELDLPLLGNGDRVKDISTTNLDELYDKGYLFYKKFKGQVGTYLIDTLTCTDELSDYFDIQNNRTMDKAIRGVRRFLFPKLHSKIKLADDGTLSPLVISLFKDIASTPLQKMKTDTEISNFIVEIDKNQKVLETSTIEINIRILPYGTTRYIDITIGFTASI